MQANWSLILNVVLLIGVIIAIARMMKARRQVAELSPRQPSIGQSEPANSSYDDIIEVRKVTAQAKRDVSFPKIEQVSSSNYRVEEKINNQVLDEDRYDEPLEKVVVEKPAPKEASSSLMMFLLAKENRQLAGYELLQTVLAAGLRFGEGNLFHRHQYSNGQGPVLCSLAAATATGVFDLQNIGGFSVHGLCIFMQASGNPTIDAERFTIMLDTAKQLSEGLDTHLLDDRRKPVNDAGIERYHRLLNLPN